MKTKYSEYAEFWDKCFKRKKADYKKLLKVNYSYLIDKLKEFKVRKVIDIGCGFGHLSIILAKNGFTVKAVDISKEAIKRVKEIANIENVKIETGVSSIQEFKTKEKFDAIICNSVLDHMELKEAKKCIRVIRNILENKGILFISFDGYEEGDKENFMLLKDGTRKYMKGKLKGMLWRYYTDEEIKELLKNFEILEFNTRKNGKREIWCRKI